MYKTDILPIGTEEELNNPKIQHLFIWTGCEDELFSLVDIITDCGVVSMLLYSNTWDYSRKPWNHKLLGLIQGRIESIEYVKNEDIPNSSNILINFICKGNSKQFRLKGRLTFSDEERKQYEEKIIPYKDNVIAIVERESLELKCFLNSKEEKVIIEDIGGIGFTEKDKIKELKECVYNKVYKIYGNDLPTIVNDRLRMEINIIAENQYSNMLMKARELVLNEKNNKNVIWYDGTIEALFVAYLMDITDVSPLPPHYICPECKYTDFTDYGYGNVVDLPDKKCPKCKHKLDKQGMNLPFETLRGFNENKRWYVDLGFSGERYAKRRTYLDNSYAALEIFTGWSNLLNYLYGLTGIDPNTIPLDDKETMTIFSTISENSKFSKKELMDLRILDSEGLIEIIKPTTFEELIEMSIVKGTAWGPVKRLQAKLIKNGTMTLKQALYNQEELLFLYLIEQGVSKQIACEIKEMVHYGRISQDKEQWQKYVSIMLKHGIMPSYTRAWEGKEFLSAPRSIKEVIDVFSIVWYKVHKPEAFNAAYEETKRNEERNKKFRHIFFNKD